VLFGSVGGKLAAVQGKLLQSDKIQLSTNAQNLDEDLFEVGALGRDEGGDRSVVWPGFPREGHEDDVALAGSLDLAEERIPFE